MIAMMAFSKVVVQSSYGRGFPGLSMNFLSLPSVVIYCVSARGNNGSTGTFRSLYCGNVFAPLKRLGHSFRLFKVYKELYL